jgi:hypothetical protein
MSATGIEFLPLKQDRRNALSTALCNLVVGPFALLFLSLMVWRVLHGAAPAFDFRFAYSAAGHRVLDGVSPYTWSAADFRQGLAFVYPALSAVMFAPLSLLPRTLGDVLFTFVAIGLVPITLRMLGVRDWRAYGIAMLWMPVFSGWMTANESLFLMFGMACLWKRRDSPLMAGLLVAVMISLKPLMWPLVLWLLVTRRWRASGYSVVIGLALNLAAWGVVGFSQIGAYLQAAGTDTSDAWRTGFGVPALLGHFGVGRNTGIVVMVVISILLVAAVVHRGFFRHDQISALTLTVALALVSSPLLWGHYVVFLLVPLAVLRPRLDWVWALPVLMWITQPAEAVHTGQEIFVWVAATTMFAVLARPRSLCFQEAMT